MAFKRTPALLIAMIAAASSNSSAGTESFSGEVIEVLSGDTVRVAHGGKRDQFVLVAATTSGDGQSWAARATERTRELCLNKQVSVSCIGRDAEGNELADVVLPDRTHLSYQLIREGLARCRRNAGELDQELAALESTARQQKIGLWSSADRSSPPQPAGQNDDRDSAAGATNIQEAVDLAIPTAPPLHGQAEQRAINEPLYGGVEERAAAQPLHAGTEQSANRQPLVGGVETKVRATDPALLQELPARDRRPGELAGRVQDSGSDPLRGKVEREGAFPFGSLNPEQEAIMHIVQYKLRFDNQPAALDAEQPGANNTPKRPPPVTMAHRPVRSLDDHAPVRSLPESEGRPRRDDGDGPPRRSELTAQPPDRQTNGWIYEPGTHLAMGGLAPGADRERPGRWIPWSSTTGGAGNVPRSAPPIITTQTAERQPARASKPGKDSGNSGASSGNGFFGLFKRPKHQQPAAGNPGDLAANGTSKQPEALLWDRWYAGVNTLVCQALKSTMPAHGNPAGKALFHITVSQNHKLKASVLSSNNDAFSAAIIEAYRSIDGSPALSFPDGTERKVVDYNSEHVQDIPAAIGAFDSRTIQGDRELIR